MAWSRSAPARKTSCIIVIFGAVLVGCSGDRADDPPGEVEPDVAGRAGQQPPDEPLDCTVKGYPCTWPEVDNAVMARIDEMSDHVLELMYEESPTALLSWLDSVPDVAETGVDGDTLAVWFRPEGGRRVYVWTPHRHEPSITSASVDSGPDGRHVAPVRAGVGGALVDWIGAALGLDDSAAPAVPAGPATAPTGVVADVTARDRDQDGRINQRDTRRALVLDPLYFEFCYGSIEDGLPDAQTKQSMSAQITAACDGTSSPGAQGFSPPIAYAIADQVAGELQRIPAYTDVTVLKDAAASHQVISTWSQYDVVFLATHGASSAWAMGMRAAPPRNGIFPTPPGPGLHLALSRAGTYGPKQYVWAVGLTYVRQALGGGLDRTFVFLGACQTAGVSGAAAPPLTQFVMGSTSGVLGWTSQIRWDDGQFLSREVFNVLTRGWTVSQAVDSLKLRRTGFLSGTGPGTQSHLAASDLHYRGRELRLFEIPTLIDPASSMPGQRGVPVVDGAPVDPFITGALGDGQNDELLMDVEVMAITDRQAAGTTVRLELDGNAIGSPHPLDPNGLVAANRYRVQFRQVPVGVDLQMDTDYHLETVVDLPEGGESRYVARLRSEACTVPTQGDFSGTLSGARARTIHRLGREGFAKILRTPMFSDWALQMDNLPAAPGQDLSLIVQFDGTPTVGSTINITDADLVAPGFGGGVDEGDQHVFWYRGTGQITFTGVVPVPNKPWDWVCGQLRADLVGMWVPPGATQPADVPGTFIGSFMAEWYPNR